MEKIYGVKDNQNISDQDLDKYSLTSYNSPEDIMENFGMSVVKIQTDMGMGSGFIVTAGKDEGNLNFAVSINYVKEELL